MDTFLQGNQRTTRHNNLEEAKLGYHYWSQRMKEKHIQLGDQPTHFFYNIIKQRQRHSRIYLLQNQEGEWLDNPMEIKNLILQYFHNVYAPPNTSTNLPLQHSNERIGLVLRKLDLLQVTEAETGMLLAPFTLNKIEQEMMDIADDKTSGSDGYSSAFFNKFWPTLQYAVFQAINHFFTAGFLLKEWNHTLMVLIPKVQPPEEVNHL